MRERIYISGAITGTEDYMERFKAAEEKLTALGYEVINPAKVNAQMPKDTTYEEYMIMSMTMLSLADGIYLIRGWETSRGARQEYGYALGAGLWIMGEDLAK